MKPPIFWFVAYPDLNFPVGGVKQLHRVSECLEALNYQSYVVQDDIHFSPSWFKSTAKRIDKNSWKCILSDSPPEHNYVVIPETMIPLVQELPLGVHKIIFNQNSSYTFGHPSSPRKFKIDPTLTLYHHSSVCQIWCVSDYDRLFLSEALGIPDSKVKKIVNCLDVSEYSDLEKKKIISFMPRKNYLHSSTLINILSRDSAFDGWEFCPIDKVSHSTALRILSESSIFLSFGYPEGFGLPVAEAMSLHCLVVGYDGLGGKELFDIGNKLNTCFQVEFGDLVSFRTRLLAAIHSISTDNTLTHRLRDVSLLLRTEYSRHSMLNSLSRAIEFML